MLVFTNKKSRQWRAVSHISDKPSPLRQQILAPIRVFWIHDETMRNQGKIKSQFKKYTAHVEKNSRICIVGSLSKRNFLWVFSKNHTLFLQRQLEMIIFTDKKSHRWRKKIKKNGWNKKPSPLRQQILSSVRFFYVYDRMDKDKIKRRFNKYSYYIKENSKNSFLGSLTKTDFFYHDNWKWS